LIPGPFAPVAFCTVRVFRATIPAALRHHFVLIRQPTAAMVCGKNEKVSWERNGEGHMSLQNSNDKGHEHSGWSWWYLLLIVQFIAVLYPPLYNSAVPAWAGIPFFYWYQMLWVIIGAVLTAIVYFKTEA
jgi:Protein of unknown function (DUF3311)